MKKLLFPLFLLLFTVAMRAQIQDPVKFKSELKTVAADEAEVVFTAAIDKGWHVYSTDLGDGGPISATFNVEKISGAEVVGKLKPVGKEISTFDKLFEMKVRYFENTAQFVQKLKLTGGAYQLEGYLEYGACNDENCLPPTQVPFQFSGKVEGAAKEAAATAKAEAIQAAVDKVNEMLKDAPSQEALDALKTQISAIETNLATISGTVDANAAAIAQLKIQMVAVEKYKELIDANAEEIDKINVAITAINRAMEDVATTADVNAIDDKVTAIAAQISSINDGLVTLLTKELRSLVFYPELYVGGIEATEYEGCAIRIRKLLLLLK